MPKYETDANFVCFKMMLIMTNSAILTAFTRAKDVAYKQTSTRDAVIQLFTQAIERAREVMWHSLDPSQPVPQEHATRTMKPNSDDDPMKALRVKYRNLESKYKLLKEQNRVLF